MAAFPSIGRPGGPKGSRVRSGPIALAEAAMRGWTVTAGWIATPRIRADLAHFGPRGSQIVYKWIAGSLAINDFKRHEWSSEAYSPRLSDGCFRVPAPLPRRAPEQRRTWSRPHLDRPRKYWRQLAMFLVPPAARSWRCPA